jgi:hypothetical protein
METAVAGWWGDTGGVRAASHMWPVGAWWSPTYESGGVLELFPIVYLECCQLRSEGFWHHPGIAIDADCVVVKFL